MTYVVRNWRLTKSWGAPVYWAMSNSEYAAQRARWATYGAISDSERARMEQKKMPNVLYRKAKEDERKKKKLMNPISVAWDMAALASWWAARKAKWLVKSKSK